MSSNHLHTQPDGDQVPKSGQLSHSQLRSLVTVLSDVSARCSLPTSNLPSLDVVDEQVIFSFATHQLQKIDDKLASEYTPSAPSQGTPQKAKPLQLPDTTKSGDVPLCGTEKEGLSFHRSNHSTSGLTRGRGSSFLRRQSRPDSSFASPLKAQGSKPSFWRVSGPLEDLLETRNGNPDKSDDAFALLDSIVDCRVAEEVPVDLPADHIKADVCKVGTTVADMERNPSEKPDDLARSPLPKVSIPLSASQRTLSHLKRQSSCLTRMNSWKPGSARSVVEQLLPTPLPKLEEPVPGYLKDIRTAADTLFRETRLEQRWKLQKKIGAGTFGSVYLAYYIPQSGEQRETRNFPAAVKVLSKDSENFNQEKVCREVFALRLLQAGGALGHTVRLYEVYEDEEQIYIVMEALLGSDLFCRISTWRSYTERNVARVVRHMLSSLASCHRLNLVHRDIKAENFCFSSETGHGKLKLIDFGISVFSTDARKKYRGVIGSPLYLAPEVLLGQPYGSAADVWSLGILCYIMLVGYPPFETETVKDLVGKIRRETIRFDGPNWEVISAEAISFVSDLLTRNPSERVAASQALQHMWVKNRCKAAPKKNLDDAHHRLIESYNERVAADP